MSLRDRRELETTREKLRLLEERYDANQRSTTSDERVRDLSCRSLKQLINQLREEIVRYETANSFQAPGK